MARCTTWSSVDHHHRSLRSYSFLLHRFDIHHSMSTITYIALCTITPKPTLDLALWTWLSKTTVIQPRAFMFSNWTLTKIRKNHLPRSEQHTHIFWIFSRRSHVIFSYSCYIIQVATTLRCELLIFFSIQFICVSLFLYAAVTADHNIAREQNQNLEGSQHRLHSYKCCSHSQFRNESHGERCSNNGTNFR